MWRKKSERKRGVQLRMKERKCSQVQMMGKRSEDGHADPDKEGACVQMGKRSEHGQIQTRRKREEGAAWEEVRGSLVSNPDIGEDGGHLDSDAEEGAWIQTQKRIWRVLGSRRRRGYGGCLDPDAEEDMEGAWIQMQKRIWRVLGSRCRRGWRMLGSS